MIFLDNKYTKWYFSLIESRKQKQNIIGEKHHIIPKSLGGNDEESNLICLTPKEHFICHKLLVKMCQGRNKQKMGWAYHRMMFSNSKNSNQYDKNRRWWSKFLYENHHAHNNEKYRNQLSEQVKKSWQNDNERREKFSKSIVKNIKKWQEENPEKFKETQRQNALKNKMKNAKRLEYKGKVYIGWAELQRKTGVSKLLYTKYYMNGIDPESRIGANGPVPKSKGKIP